MNKPRNKLFLFSLILLSLHYTTVISWRQTVVYPNCTSYEGTPPCDTLDSALSELANNNDTIIRLQGPGIYTLTNVYIISNTDNFTISAQGPANQYIIQCNGSYGLGFLNVNQLQLINVTVNKCGIYGHDIIETLDLFLDHIDLFYRIPANVQYSVILGDCANVSMSSVVFTNTTGLGLLAINIMGTSYLNNVEFISNRAPLCTNTSLTNVTSEETIGGGMFLIYHDYYDTIAGDAAAQLIINEGLFQGNSYCSIHNSISSFYGESVTAERLGYEVASAAALGVTLAQLEFSVNIIIDSITVINNTGLIGAGVHIGIFQDVKNSNINFTNCSFEGNGFENYSNLPSGLRSQSAGLFIYDNLQFPNRSQSKPSNTLPVSVSVMDSLFSDNQAHTCAAFQVSSHQSGDVRQRNQNIFQLINTSFINNQGFTGPVACAVSSEANGLQSSFKLIFHDVTVTNNSVQSSSDGGVVNRLVESSGHILLVSVSITISGVTLFTNNSGVVIVVVNSLLNLDGDIQFIGNKGVFGGALRMHTQSFLTIQNNTNVSFISNQATVEGGAIYYSVSSIADSNPLDEGDCFLYFQQVDKLCNYSSCPDIGAMNFHLTFKDNTARQGGTIYGSTLNSCPWYYTFQNTDTTTTALQFLSTNFKDKFHFDPPLNDSSVISTNSARLQFVDSDKTFATNPGGRISLQVSAYDRFNFRTSTALVSASDNSSSLSTRLGNSVYYYISSTDANGTMVPLDVTGYQYNTANVEIFSVDSGVQSIIMVSTENCGPGFVYNVSSKSCECLQQLEDKGVTCDVKSETLIIPDNYWFGMLNVTDNDSISVYSSCFYDYCTPSQTIVSVLDLNAQCNGGYNRGGLSCGVCMEGTSAVFGTSRCKDCTNIGLFWILGLALAGIIVTFGISLLGITITEGYLNGFIFYCNSLNYFFVYLSPKSPLDLIFSPVAWVNFGLGIESCFYNGMTTLGRIGLRLVFPLYLFLLMGLIIILAQKVKKFSSLRFSASKTFATLILLSYFSILGTCIEIMTFTRYKGLVHDNVSYTRWNLDPSQVYGHGAHGFLIAIALCLLLFYIIPFPILFLFPKLLYSLPFVNKFKPIYDAFWNPFKPQFRFWLSFRAFLRLIPFCLSLFASYPSNVLGMVIFVPLVWFLHERLLPFVGYWQNSFDSFFLLNLVFLFIGNIYYERYRDEDHNYPKGYKVLVYMLVMSAYLAFLIILLIHVFIRFPKLKTKLESFCVRKEKRMKEQKLLKTISKSVFSLNSSEDDEEETLSDDIPKVVTYSEFREPLLDEYGTITLDTRTVSI